MVYYVLNSLKYCLLTKEQSTNFCMILQQLLHYDHELGLVMSNIIDCVIIVLQNPISLHVTEFWKIPLMGAFCELNI